MDRPIKRMRIVENQTFEGIQQTQASGFKKLNEDCILQIFQHLTIADRFRIERVCKKWCALSQKSWYTFKTLNTRFDTWGVTKRKFLIIDNKIVDKMERLCGKYLKNISLNQAAFRKICKSSQNFQELELFDIQNNEVDRYKNRVGWPKGLHTNIFTSTCNCPNDWQEIITWIIPKCHQVTSFRLFLCHGFSKEEEIASILAVMKNLQILVLRVDIGPTWTGTYFDKLSFDTLRELCLDNIRNMSSNSVISIIKKCNKLRKIKLKYIVEDESNMNLFCDAISKHAKSLKSLYVGFCSSVPVFESITTLNLSIVLLNVSKWTFLETLIILCFRSINNEFLKVVSQYCKQLTHLRIFATGKNEITDEGIEFLSDLPKLRILELKYMQALQRPLLTKLEKLEILDCYRCENLQDESLCPFLSKASQLRVIDVTLCNNLTINTVKAAARSVKMRSSNIPLDFYAFDCYKIISEYKDVTPALLKVHHTIVKTHDPPRYRNIELFPEDLHLGLTKNHKLTTKQIYFIPHIYQEFETDPDHIKSHEKLV